MTATTVPTCKYCLPMGAKITSSQVCERHTTLFDVIDPMIIGKQVTQRLREAHEKNQSITLDMSFTDPRLGVDVMGTVVGYSKQPPQIGPVHRWTVRDLNGELWVGESSRKGKVAFVPRFLDDDL